jgi:glutathione-specific gamma-glutamylcyclotransferase
MSLHPDAEHCRWIFAYGSLIWNPGFEFEHSARARLAGFHRRLSVFSNHYRGTNDKPGLVLGLDRGGSCAGLAYCVAEQKWGTVLDYVRSREMIGGVYREMVKRVYVEGQKQPVLALTYAVKHNHHQCAPHMPLDETLKFIRQGQGIGGSCCDYIVNTVEHLHAIGIYDSALEKLYPHLRNGG